ncbi:MAG: hypothetical protein ACOYMN_04230 [Roseimicrobium sp.]
MAKLTLEQQQTVAQWATEGATLNEIQDRLKRELGVTLTYMDTRLLVMELGVKIQDKPKEKPPETEAPPEGSEPDEDILPQDDLPQGGHVTVSLDVVAVPGTMVSGKTTFTDGVTATWSLDQFGRLGLRAPEPGYQPPPEDIPQFQKELQRLLRAQGF